MNQSQEPLKNRFKKPPWLSKRIMYTDERNEVSAILSELRLNTVCRSARCPNLSECYSHKRATFLILGSKCTRSCRFCAVEHAGKGKLEMPDSDEPNRIAEAVKKLGLNYVVITSVTRDDLDDGGASHFAKTIEAIRSINKDIKIEVLTPDFKGDLNALRIVLDKDPDVFNHNVETVPRLYPRVRPEADFLRSINVLRNARLMKPGMIIKSGMMVGLGESEEEVVDVIKILREAGCDALTIGQYLQPTRKNLEVNEYVKPEVFEKYKLTALEIGFRYVASAPYVRSSYMAHIGYENMVKFT
ncbi:MAG: lipoyl synthase [Spirochaetes bacterium]|nr:MAG: lipoyl synthase [Spirochaetota bacterium]